MIGYCRFVVEPTASPFSACSTFHAPGARETDWSCANSFVYAVRGYADHRTTPLVDVGDQTALRRGLLDVAGEAGWSGSSSSNSGTSAAALTGGK